MVDVMLHRMLDTDPESADRLRPDYGGKQDINVKLGSS